MTDAATTAIRQSVEARTLVLLSDGKPHTSRELATVAPSAARRVWDACKEFGLDVERRKVGADSWLWTWRDPWRLADVLAALREPRSKRTVAPVQPRQTEMAL